MEAVLDVIMPGLLPKAAPPGHDISVSCLIHGALCSGDPQSRHSDPCILRSISDNFFSTRRLKYDENSAFAMNIDLIQSTFGEAFYYLKGA